MHHFFKGKFFDFEVIRILGMAPNGGADVAEVLEAVGNIKDGDPDSWSRAWATQAQRAEALADEALCLGHGAAACHAYLRASNYTRASGYMLAGAAPGSPDPKQRLLCEHVRALFSKAAVLMGDLEYCTVEHVQIPYKHGNGSSNGDGHDAADAASRLLLPGNLYLPPPHRRLPSGEVPVLICCGGADALQEELFYMHPSAGPGLGYAVLTFEGPGQGLTLRQKGIPMRPDWENVVGPVLDFVGSLARERPGLGLDLSRVAVAGASLGAYFALRATADERVSACVALDPLYSFWDFATAHVSPLFLGAWDRGWLGDAAVDLVIGSGMSLNFQMRWEVSLAGSFFGIRSPARILKEMKRYTLSGGHLGRVRCPVLVSGASESLYLEPSHHTMRVHDELTNLKPDDKQLWLAMSPGQGSLQAKMGAMQLVNQRTFSFLDKAFGIVRPSGLAAAARSGGPTPPDIKTL